MYAYNYKGEVATSAKQPTGDFVLVVNPQKDKLFRKAQRIIAGEYVVDLAEAKLIVHSKRRAKRMIEFAPYDEVIRLDIPGQDRTVAEAVRVNIRAVDAQRQTDIDACVDEAALRVLIMAEEL